MKVYKNIQTIESKNTKTGSGVVVSYKKLKMFSFLFVCILSFGILGFSLSSLNLSEEVKNITASWSPNIADLGKLKFVINQDGFKTEEEVLMSATEMAMPFDNNFVTEVETGVFLVNGLGSVVVKACLEGKVTKIENFGEHKTVYLSHGKGLTSVYEKMETVGVKEGAHVEKNTPIGVSLSSVIQLKLLYKNKTLVGLTVKDGELSFM